MIDSERFKLLYGPYVAPKCALGDKLPCEYRGREVTVKGMSAAPIQWPSTRRNGHASPILCGDLIRAVRTESQIAVAHHLGVSNATAWKWRRALSVRRLTNGSRRLRIEYTPEILAPDARAQGIGFRGHHESAGINRHGVADARAAQGRSSDPP